jgi:hypothetical protein
MNFSSLGHKFKFELSRNFELYFQINQVSLYIAMLLHTLTVIADYIVGVLALHESTN